MGSAAMSVVPLSDRRDEESCLKHSDPYQPVVPERNPALNLIGTIAQPPKWEHARKKFNQTIGFLEANGSHGGCRVPKVLRETMDWLYSLIFR